MADGRANEDAVPQAAPVLRRAEIGAETEGVVGGAELPLPACHVQRGVGWLPGTNGQEPVRRTPRKRTLEPLHAAAAPRSNLAGHMTATTQVAIFGRSPTE